MRRIDNQEVQGHGWMEQREYSCGAAEAAGRTGQNFDQNHRQREQQGGRAA
ncbi:hypothetical protein ACFTAO_34645 [Paenibacillus rhizoplanae]